jgi:multidrug efflux pump
MYLLGYSLDNLSLMALTVATGFVVDDAIVVVGERDPAPREGMSPFDAAVKGATEIGFTVLVHQHLAHRGLHPHPLDGRDRGPPLPRVRGHPVRGHRGLLLISLTTTPMMCARLLKRPREEGEHGRLFQASERMFQAVLHRYERALHWVLAISRSPCS